MSRAVRLRGQEIQTVIQSHFPMQKGFWKADVGSNGQKWQLNIRLVSWKNQWSLSFGTF